MINDLFSSFWILIGVKWLLDNDVKTVAMKSTGSYWQKLFTENTKFIN